MKNITLGIFVLIFFCISCSNSDKYASKKFTAEQVLEGSTKIYVEYNFIDDSTCSYFRNEYDHESDKMYNYENSKKMMRYRKEGNFLVLTSMEGNDKTKLEINQNKLILHLGNASAGTGGKEIILSN